MQFRLAAQGTLYKLAKLRPSDMRIGREERADALQDFHRSQHLIAHHLDPLGGTDIQIIGDARTLPIARVDIEDNR